MLGLEMYVNGKKVCTAGGDSGHVNASLAAYWGPIAEGLAPFADLRRPLAVSVIVGMHRGKTVLWPKAELGIGDEVTFKLVETDEVDPGVPVKQHPGFEPPGWKLER